MDMDQELLARAAKERADIVAKYDKVSLIHCKHLLFLIA